MAIGDIPVYNTFFPYENLYLRGRVLERRSLFLWKDLEKSITGMCAKKEGKWIAKKVVEAMGSMLCDMGGFILKKWDLEGVISMAVREGSYGKFMEINSRAVCEEKVVCIRIPADGDGGGGTTSASN